MEIILPVLGVALAAICVWLTVRIVNKRERWAMWTAVLLAVIAAYPLSLFPIKWLETRYPLYEFAWADDVLLTYRAPAYWLADNGPEWIEYIVDSLESYAVPLN